MTTAPRARITSAGASGQWQVFVYPEGAQEVRDASDYDVTMFRGAATEVSSLGTTDPFGPSAATLRFPQITYFDQRGSGDLWWCLPEANVDICWVTPAGVVYRWEGFLSSFEWGEDAAMSSMTVQCQGALKQLDLYLATPEYLYAPLTFERAILRQMERRPHLRTAPPVIKWPPWWNSTYSLSKQRIGQPWMIPMELSEGQPWTEMLTRYTGQFEQVLSGYIQQLLSSMHTPRGQWTLMLDLGRAPVLKHRDMATEQDDNTLVVDLLWPGVSLSGLHEDHTQKLNVVYAQGRTLSGVTYTGMQVTNDGAHTSYEPFAARRQAHPVEDNPWLDLNTMRREVHLEMADGVAVDEARNQSRTHLQKFSDPGLTGTLSLNTDPVRGMPGSETTFPRQAITAGMSVLVRGLFGRPEGKLFHITQTSCSIDGAQSLTIDSKYRDQLTVQEVIARGRDSLTPTRMLTTGAWQPNVQDLLFPWSYDLGSGYIPHGSSNLFRGIGTHEQFPWENWTRAHPPKDPQWADMYIHIGPKSATTADANWSTPLEGGIQYPILLSAAGSSRLVQLAAYDADGNVMPVGFHFSIYNSNTLSPTVGPVIPVMYEGLTGYKAGQHHPFWPGAWETVDENGVAQNPLTPQAEASASIIVGWGNYYEKAGYWPGTSSDPNDSPTGLFVDEASFSWDTTQLVGGVAPQEEASLNTADIKRAMVYCLIYCEDQGPKDVYFLGRVFRAEPGSA